jgi:phosphatidylglycerol:prolipoprotein diacylglycerol transferase
VYRIAIRIPPLGVIHASHLALMLAVVVCVWIAVRALRRIDGIEWHRARWGFLLLAIIPWIGGHIHSVANNWEFASSSLWRLLAPWAGLHAGGVVISLAVTAPLVLRYYRVSVGPVADALVPVLGAGIVIGRLGCFLEGCCFGKVCSWPWCLSYPRDAYVYDFHRSHSHLVQDALRSAPIHPLPLYFAAVGLLLIATSRWLEPRKRYQGQVSLIALLVFSVTAALLESFREDSNLRVYWGPLPQLTWTALAMSCAALGALLAAELVHARRTALGSGRAVAQPGPG